jgi:hypothetical protein
MMYILELNKSKIKQNLLSGRVRSLLEKAFSEGVDCSRSHSPVAFPWNTSRYRSVVKSAGRKIQLEIFAFIPYNMLSEAMLLKRSEFNVIVTISSVRKDDCECVNKCSV